MVSCPGDLGSRTARWPGAVASVMMQLLVWLACCLVINATQSKSHLLALGLTTSIPSIAINLPISVPVKPGQLVLARTLQTASTLAAGRMGWRAVCDLVLQELWPRAVVVAQVAIGFIPLAVAGGLLLMSAVVCHAVWQCVWPPPSRIDSRARDWVRARGRDHVRARGRIRALGRCRARDYDVRSSTDPRAVNRNDMTGGPLPRWRPREAVVLLGALG